VEGRAPEELSDDSHLLDALRAGDEGAFVLLVERYQASMLRLARIYVHDPASAEDAVQEAWLGVLRGLARFEGRSSLKTWIFRILLNLARTSWARERRSVPFSRLADRDRGEPEPSVDPDRFLDALDPREPHHWAHPPRRWRGTPEDWVLSREVQACLKSAIEALPTSQREVITLRDVEGWSAEEVCNVLGVSGTNLRVLLHRARSRVRRALERYFQGGQA
jgi:RNA polymerase sigma-70 factor (ECF subfamily)